MALSKSDQLSTIMHVNTAFLRGCQDGAFNSYDGKTSVSKMIISKQGQRDFGDNGVHNIWLAVAKINGIEATLVLVPILIKGNIYNKVVYRIAKATRSDFNQIIGLLKKKSSKCRSEIVINDYKKSPNDLILWSNDGDKIISPMLCNGSPSPIDIDTLSHHAREFLSGIGDQSDGFQLVSRNGKSQTLSHAASRGMTSRGSSRATSRAASPVPSLVSSRAASPANSCKNAWPALPKYVGAAAGAGGGLKTTFTSQDALSDISNCVEFFKHMHGTMWKTTPASHANTTAQATFLEMIGTLLKSIEPSQIKATIGEIQSIETLLGKNLFHKWKISANQQLQHWEQTQIVQEQKKKLKDKNDVIARLQKQIAALQSKRDASKE
jgi:hypothetical protein